jgi:hypothetical protein
VVAAQVLTHTKMNVDYLSMSFDELMERQRVLNKKYNAAYAGGASQEVMSQLLQHIEAIRQAMWEMGYKQSFKDSNDNDPFKDSIVN